MEFLHPAMWHDHDIDFVRWLHPAMWYVALESWQWIHQVAAPCNVICGSGMTWHWIRLNVRHIRILHLVSISTHHRSRHVILLLARCSVPVCEILSKSDHPRQKKMTSCRFSRWQISAILDCRDPIIGSLKSQRTTSYRSSRSKMANLRHLGFYGSNHSPDTACWLCHHKKRAKMASTVNYNLWVNHRYSIANFNFNLTVIRLQQLNILSRKQAKLCRK